jgi:hypothetical protein
MLDRLPSGGTGLNGMANTEVQSNAGVIDVLFAVALGEGVFSGLNRFSDEVVSGEVFALGSASRGTYRVFLAFLLILLSWLHYRRSTMASYDRYPTAEFAADVLVIVAYMTLFLFVDAPVAFYTTVALIWMIYVITRVDLWIHSPLYLLFGLLFIGAFVGVAATTWAFPGAGAEWARLLFVTAAIVAYRPLDRRFMWRIRGESP